LVALAARDGSKAILIISFYLHPFIRKRYVHSIEDEQILQASIKGVEKKQLPYFLCVTNLMLHGIDTPTQVVHDNTLAALIGTISRKIALMRL
jgi:hypothetical protein